MVFWKTLDLWILEGVEACVPHIWNAGIEILEIWNSETLKARNFGLLTFQSLKRWNFESFKLWNSETNMFYVDFICK